MADRRPIPLRPDPSALRAETVGALARAIIVKAHARLENRRDEASILRLRFPDDPSALLMLRAASSPTTTTSASALVQTVVADIMSSIGAVGAGARLLQSALLLSFDDGVGMVSVPGVALSASKAAFIEEGAPIPINDLAATTAALLPHKLASIFTLTSEMVSGSNAEAIVTDAMLRCVGLALDNVLFDTLGADAVRAAGLRYNIAALPSSTAGTSDEVMVDDLAAVTGSVAKVGGSIAVVMAPERAITLSLRLPRDPPFAIYGSPCVDADDVIAIAVGGLAAAVDSVPQVDTSRVATLDMESPAQPISGGAPVRSLLQTDCVATKIRFGASWALRTADACAWTTAQGW
jgi:hypothetical protein